MKLFIRLCVFLAIGILATGCTIGNGRICGPQTPSVYCDREAYERLVNPKAYGEFFVKPGVTKDAWRQDWVACGGWANGQYGADQRLPGELGDIEAAGRKADQLSSCMQSKGYSYQRD